MSPPREKPIGLLSAEYLDALLDAASEPQNGEHLDTTLCDPLTGDMVLGDPRIFGDIEF